jgi:Pyruvate:ferredoxin oxidoreductase and related 2-oxoacid:ferredoxin oxidoreductases, gamma subunit
MNERVEICLSGSGGQGMILAGIILADAAIREGKSVVQSQSYGPEARGRGQPGGSYYWGERNWIIQRSAIRTYCWP